MNVEKQSETIVFRIKQRAIEFALDNLKRPNSRDLLMIENAMLIGSSIALEVKAEIEAEENSELTTTEETV